MSQTAINSTTIQSANTKAIGSITYNEANNKKAGSLLVSYGGANITFATVADYLIFVNEVIIPQVNKIHSASLGTAQGITGYLPAYSGAASTDAITD